MFPSFKLQQWFQLLNTFDCCSVRFHLHFHGNAIVLCSSCRWRYSSTDFWNTHGGCWAFHHLILRKRSPQACFRVHISLKEYILLFVKERVLLFATLISTKLLLKCCLCLPISLPSFTFLLTPGFTHMLWLWHLIFHFNKDSWLMY